VRIADIIDFSALISQFLHMTVSEINPLEDGGLAGRERNGIDGIDGIGI
jgi:hypothetical protein